MAKLIVKWRYIAKGTPKHSQHLVKYIATRDGVEKCDESWKVQPATVEQKRLIDELLKDFPEAVDLPEYADYLETPNKYYASIFISEVVDENIDITGKKQNYVEYIAKRPRVEKQGKHGLFTQSNGPINLSQVAKTVAEHDGPVWTTILSLRREDAERLGWDNAQAWRKMLQSKTEILAEAMGVSVTDLRWYAAFHNEGNHPHVHIVSYTVDKDKNPFMTENGLMRMKSKYAHEIFKQDFYSSYQEQNKHRAELRQLAKERVKQIVVEINSSGYHNEMVETLLLQLKEELKRYKGKMVYGYLPRRLKNIVNGIVDELSRDKRVQELYNLWYEQKENIIGIYQDKMSDRLPLSRNDEFKTIRNAVLQEVANIQFDGKIEEQFFGNNKQMAKDEAKQKIVYLENLVGFGNAYAEYQLGAIYLFGNGVDQDYYKAMEWLKKSADNGNKYAEQLLKTAQENHNHSVTMGATRLLRYLTKLLQDNIDKADKNSRGLIDKKARPTRKSKRKG